MTKNDFLAFAGGAGANVLKQDEYEALSQLVANGFRAGGAKSAEVNKVLRQASIMAAVLAQFVVERTGKSALDDGTTAALLANLKAAAAAPGGDAANAFEVANATKPQHAMPLRQADAKYLPIADAAKTYLSAEAAKQYLLTDEAKKTYISITEAKQRFAKGIQVFTEDGEFVVPPGIYQVFVTLVGGGGGGGGGGRDTRNVFVPGGGGGAGEFKYRIAVPVTPGQRIKVTVGKAGQGGKTILAPQNKPLPDGHAGGISSFGQLISVSGGGAGNGGFTGSGSVGGAGGAGYPGGDSGEYTATPNNSYVRGGGGGSSPLGGGGPSVHGYQSRAGGGYGAGGGGGALYYLKGEDADGGPGSQGIVIVEW